jgi:hypothetical protein
VSRRVEPDTDSDADSDSDSVSRMVISLLPFDPLRQRRALC